MKRIVYLVFLFVAMLALTLVTGCSDDDDKTSTGGTTQGDTNDVSFQFIDSTLGQDIFESLDNSISLAFALMGEIIAPPGARLPEPGRLTSLAPEQEDLIIIDSVTGYLYTESDWHVLEFYARIISSGGGNDTVRVWGIDSLQLLSDGLPIGPTTPEEEIDAVKARAHVIWLHSDDAEGVAHHLLDLGTEVSGVDTLMLINATLNDTTHSSWSNDSTSCDLSTSANSSIVNLRVLPDEEEVCPRSGRITVSATVDLSCTGSGSGIFDQLDVNKTWTITATINNDDTVTFTFSNGATMWTLTRPCLITPT